MARGSFVHRLREVLFQGPRPSEHLTLAPGVNTLTRPAGADGCVIFPDRASAQTIRLKGNAGDVGLSLSTKAPSVITCAADIIINAGGTRPVAVRWFRLQ